MAATATVQARLLRELADRIERGAQLLPGELAERLSAEVKRASEQERIATAVDEVIDSHEDILAELAKCRSGAPRSLPPTGFAITDRPSNASGQIGGNLRIISARRATKRERRAYEED